MLRIDVDDTVMIPRQTHRRVPALLMLLSSALTLTIKDKSQLRRCFCAMRQLGELYKDKPPKTHGGNCFILNVLVTPAAYVIFCRAPAAISTSAVPLQVYPPLPFFLLLPSFGPLWWILQYTTFKILVMQLSFLVFSFLPFQPFVPSISKPTKVLA